MAPFVRPGTACALSHRTLHYRLTFTMAIALIASLMTLSIANGAEGVHKAARPSDGPAAFSAAQAWHTPSPDGALGAATTAQKQRAAQLALANTLRAAAHAHDRATGDPANSHTVLAQSGPAFQGEPLSDVLFSPRPLSPQSTIEQALPAKAASARLTLPRRSPRRRTDGANATPRVVKTALPVGQPAPIPTALPRPHPHREPSRDKVAANQTRTAASTADTLPDAPRRETATVEPASGTPATDEANVSNPVRMAVAKEDAVPEKAVESPAQGAPAASPVQTSAIRPRSAALASGNEPWQLMRTLNALQDDIARGSGAALVAQRVLKERIEAFAKSAPADLWTKPRNTAALLAYALSGGAPQTVERVLSGNEFEAPFDALLRGALAYIEGREADAERHFEGVAAERLPHSVRGPVYLALAALSVDEDSEATRQYLDRARYAAPGTLIEEAALRRAVLLAAERDDIDTFARLTNRYVRKYRASVYAGNFRKRLSAAITRMVFIEEEGAFSRLDEILAPMSVAGRQELFLVMARAAIENGSHTAARQAAERALATALPDTLDHRRAELYKAAADVVDPDRYETAIETLHALAPDNLSADDRALQTAAKALVSSISTLPDDAVPDDALEALAREAAAAAPQQADEAEVEPANSAAQLDPTLAELPTDGPFAAPVELETKVAEALATIDRMLEDAR